MKKILLFFALTTFVGCVDNDFDLSKVDDSDIVIGNEFIAPIGNINIKYNDIAELPLPESDGMVDFILPEEFGMDYSLSSGFDQGILDMITESGSQSVMISITHKLPADVKLNLKVSFDVAGELYSGAVGENIEVKITKEQLQKITESKNISVEFITSGNRNVKVKLDDAIVIGLGLYRKGGIKL